MGAVSGVVAVCTGPKVAAVEDGLLLLLVGDVGVLVVGLVVGVIVVGVVVVGVLVGLPSGKAGIGCVGPEDGGSVGIGVGSSVSTPTRTVGLSVASVGGVGAVG